MRKLFLQIAVISLIAFAVLAYLVSPGFWWVFGVVALLTIWGIYDMNQTKHSLMRNFPLFGRARWIMEALRPKLYQYFVESDTDGRPINRIDRSTVYQRAKLETDTMPFGTQLNVYAEG